MLNLKSATRSLRDQGGAAIVEATLTIPIFLLLVLGTVDASYLLYDYALANKAVYKGARVAIVSTPVAPTITTATYTSAQLANLGSPCYNGTANNCPASVTVVCTGTGTTTVTASCSPGTYGVSSLNFKAVLDVMRATFPKVQAQNVTITYTTNNQSGFVGTPADFGGLPMNVTVSLRCVSHELYFLDSLMRWVMTPPQNCPQGTVAPVLPAFATTMQSEDMTTN